MNGLPRFRDRGGGDESLLRFDDESATSFDDSTFSVRGERGERGERGNSESVLLPAPPGGQLPFNDEAAAVGGASSRQPRPELARIYTTAFGDHTGSESSFARVETPETARSSHSPPPAVPAMYESGWLDDGSEQQLEPALSTPVSSPPAYSPTYSPRMSPLMHRRRVATTPPRVAHVNDLPPDVIAHVAQYLTNVRDLVSFMCVQRRWTAIGAQRLWMKPHLSHGERLERFSRMLSHKPHGSGSGTYAPLVVKLNLAQVAAELTDERLAPLVQCTRIQRLSLTKCALVSDAACARLVRQLPRLESLDLMGTALVADLTLRALADCCEVQTLLLGCQMATEEALLALARQKGCFLRRLRLADCPLISAEAVVMACVKCPRLAELNTADMACCSERATERLMAAAVAAAAAGQQPHAHAHPPQHPGFSDSQVHRLLKGCPSLRDLTLSNCVSISKNLFEPWSSGLTIRRIDQLRALALVGSFQITDSTVRYLTAAVPRLRQLDLSKCPLVTDRSLVLIAETYRGQLAHLHLGHCANITDRGVIAVVAQCRRLDFFDAGNCVRLTDASLCALATLPKLRRVGMVRCPKIGRDGVLALAFPHDGVAERPLERLHLSYCPGVTIDAVRAITNCCRRLVHLSLTGIPCFLRPDILRLRRPPPSDFKEHQKDVFCVFSGSSIPRLRRLLNVVGAPLVVPLPPPPPPHQQHQQQQQQQQQQLRRFSSTDILQLNHPMRPLGGIIMNTTMARDHRLDEDL